MSTQSSNKPAEVAEQKLESVVGGAVVLAPQISKPADLSRPTSGLELPGVRSGAVSPCF